MSENILFINDVILKERSSIHDDIDPKLIYPSIKVMQDMYIEPILGSNLYQKIQAIIESGDINLPAFSAYKNLLDNYIIDTLLFYTLADLAFNLSYQFWNKGVVRKQGDNTELPSLSDITDIENKNKIKGEWYANRLRLHLIDRHATLYPEYYVSANKLDDVLPQGRNEACAIYLGGDDNCGCGGGIPRFI
jgi:hypothetical protein